MRNEPKGMRLAPPSGVDCPKQSTVADSPSMGGVFWLLHTVASAQLLDQSASDARSESFVVHGADLTEIISVSMLGS